MIVGIHRFDDHRLAMLLQNRYGLDDLFDRCRVHLGFAESVDVVPQNDREQITSGQLVCHCTAGFDGTEEAFRCERGVVEFPAESPGSKLRRSHLVLTEQFPELADVLIFIWPELDCGKAKFRNGRDTFVERSAEPHFYVHGELRVRRSAWHGYLRLRFWVCRIRKRCTGQRAEDGGCGDETASGDAHRCVSSCAMIAPTLSSRVSSERRSPAMMPCLSAADFS